MAYGNKLTPLASQMAGATRGYGKGVPSVNLYQAYKNMGGAPIPSPAPPRPPSAPSAPSYEIPGPGKTQSGQIFPGNPTVATTPGGIDSIASTIAGGVHPGGPGQGAEPAPHTNPYAARMGDMSGMQSALNASGTYASPGQMGQIAQQAITPGAGQVYDAAVGGVRPAGIPQGATIGMAQGDYTPGGLLVGEGGYSGAGNWQQNAGNPGDTLAWDALTAGQNVPVLDVTTGQYVNQGGVQPVYNPARGYGIGTMNTPSSGRKG